MKLYATRRHLDSCPHKSRGRNYTLCQCPIWTDGDLNGKRFRRSLNTNDLTLALRRIGRLERGEDQDFLPAAPERTTGSAIEAYIKDARARDLQESSITSIEGVLKQFTKFVGETPLASIRPEHVAQFRGRRVMKVLTQRKEIEYLRSLFNFCVAQEWIQKNPAKQVKLPLVKDSSVLPYSAEEVQKLLASCDRVRGMGADDTPLMRQRARTLLNTLLYTGLRVSDIAQLKRSALAKSNHLVLRTTKNNVPVKVLLPAAVADALRTLPAISGNPTYFYWSGNGDWHSCSKVLWRFVSGIGKKAGIKAHPHRFRHTFAVELISRGEDIRRVQLLLGHESIRTTEKHYAHFIPKHQDLLDEAVKKLDFSPDTSARPLLVSPRKNRRRNA